MEVHLSKLGNIQPDGNRYFFELDAYMIALQKLEQEIEKIANSK